MGKKKRNENLLFKLKGRKLPDRDRSLFQQQPRGFGCLSKKGDTLLEVSKLDATEIKLVLYKCKTIEHQFIALRECTQLTEKDYKQRSKFTSLFLQCLSRHHDAFYEGILFGSTVNGLGFKDSDVDLRLRRLVEVERGVYEPVALNDDMIERILKNVAFQTTRCCPSIGDFVPSTRCPVAKLTFYRGKFDRFDPKADVSRLKEGLKYDVSLSSSNPLASFNSKFLRFLCELEPKFHLLATVVRYWSNVHKLIVPGYLSSYALINMLIFFCQTVDPPLLPTVDKMREVYLETKSDDCMDEEMRLRAISQLEWHCLICFNKESYEPSKNTEPLAILLFKFFEFCLNFNYSARIMTIRPGRALTRQEFEESTQFHPRFSITPYLCIQDPFDLKHNLTSGMQGSHFRRFMVTIRYSYERLFSELLKRFTYSFNRKDKNQGGDSRNWGLNALFVRLSDQELKEA